MLVLYGLMYVFLTPFFATFTLFSAGYLIGFPVKRRYSQPKPVVKALESAYS